MILAPADSAAYFPDVDVDPSTLQGLLRQAQAIAEGPAGANRSLEAGRFTETPRVGGNGIAKLSRLPLIVDGDNPFVAEIRGVPAQAYLGGLDGNDWVTLSEDDYELDFELGEIRIRGPVVSGFNGSSFTRGGGVYTGRHSSRIWQRPTQARSQATLKVTYTTGWDFGVLNSTDPNIQTIKACVAGIFRLQQSNMGQGLKQFTLENFYSATLDSTLLEKTSSAGAGSPFEDLLQVLRKYRPKEFS